MPRRQPLPTIWLMTDERLGEELWQILDRVPRGGGVIFRDYASADRRARFDRVRSIALKRHLLLVLAGPPERATGWKAAGFHGRTRRRASCPLIHTMPVHNAMEMVLARQCQADLIFLSPLYPTRSHPGAPTLGRIRFAALARLARGIPVIALGGVTPRHRHQLRRIGAAGWAGIDAFAGPDDLIRT